MFFTQHDDGHARPLLELCNCVEGQAVTLANSTHAFLQLAPNLIMWKYSQAKSQHGESSVASLLATTRLTELDKTP
jgi:hypothetical protein